MSPSELEDVILQHPEVVDAGVVGVEHDRMGEAPRAFVATKKLIPEEEIHKYLLFHANIEFISQTSLSL